MRSAALDVQKRNAQSSTKCAKGPPNLHWKLQKLDWLTDTFQEGKKKPADTVSLSSFPVEEQEGQEGERTKEREQ